MTYICEVATNGLCAALAVTNALIPTDYAINCSYYDLEIPTNAVTAEVVTNVVEWSNESGCKMCHEAGPGFVPAILGHVPCKPWQPATERTKTTIVTETKCLRFLWLGKWRELREEKELSRTAETWRLRENWEKVDGLVLHTNLNSYIEMHGGKP